MNGPQEHFKTADHFERELLRAMRAVDPPANFVDTVLQRAAHAERPGARVLPMPTRWRAAQIWASGAIAATLLLGIGVQQVHHRRERSEATRQFEMATQIEQQALDRTRERLSRSGISLEPQ